MALPAIRVMAPKGILKRFELTALVATIVARFSPWLNSPCRLTERDGTPRDTAWIGRYGERVAVSWLRSKGCKILSRNYRGPKGGEVDIIAREARLLLFIEVKTRKAGQALRPLDAVDRDKQALIERGANHWIMQLGHPKPAWRYDVCEVILQDGKKPRVKLVRDAF
jgi:putative endonuclease